MAGTRDGELRQLEEESRSLAKRRNAGLVDVSERNVTEIKSRAERPLAHARRANRPIT